jgi:streptomycin 6-kinase
MYRRAYPARCAPALRKSVAGRLTRQANVIAEAAHLDRDRLLRWVVAWAGLSAAFDLEDGLPAEGAPKFTELAAAELSR